MIDSCGSVHCHLSFMFESCVLFCVTDKFVVEISDHIMLVENCAYEGYLRVEILYNFCTMIYNNTKKKLDMYILYHDFKTTYCRHLKKNTNE